MAGWLMRTSSIADHVRLHAGESPYGASPRVYDAIAHEIRNVHEYPDPTSRQLVDAIAEHYGVQRERVSVGNGIDELILFLVLALGDRERPGAITGATFQSYFESFAVARRPLIQCPLEGYRVPTTEIARRLRTTSAFAFVCNPHNPTGTVLSDRDLDTLHRAAIDGGSFLIVDEAYAEYAGSGFSSALESAATGCNACVLRTFSKAYGLAGLRVGYAIGEPRLIAMVNAQQRPLPYHVNRVAQAAAVAALADQEFVLRNARRTREARDWFREAMLDLGLASPPSSANFVLVGVGPDGGHVVDELERRGYRIRDTRAMGLEGHIRISIGTRRQMIAVRDAIRDILVSSPALAGPR